jgi:integrase/recombinase XerC
MFIENFLSFLQYEKRYSENTLVAYKTDLIQFTDFLKLQYQIQNPSEASHLFIRSFIINLIEQNVTPRSVNRKISTLKSFYKFLKKRNLIKINPMQKVISPKTSKKLPVYVEGGAMKNLLSHDFFTNDFEGQRDKLIVELFYNTGIRRAELIGIKINDISLSQKTLKVLGKGNKERIIPFNQELAIIIEQYLNYRAELIDNEKNNVLLLTSKGKPLNESLVYNKVKHYLSLVTTIDKKSPHVLRHTFATHLTNQGAELNAIKELLGHSSLAATQVYTHNNIQKLKDIYKLSHPKA